MVMSFVRRAALTSLAPLLLLGACAEDKPDPPAAEPTSSPPSVTASEEPASAEPTLPPEAEGTGPEAAEAFVRHYYEVGDYAHATGDASRLRSLGTMTCEACKRAAQAIEDVYQQGGTIQGGEVTVEKTIVTPTRRSGAPPGSIDVTATVTNTDQVVAGSDDWDGEYPADTIRVRFELVRVANSFRIARWSQI